MAISNELVGAVIPAAGQGRRMGGADKAFLELDGLPILARTVEVFEGCPEIDRIVLVVGAGSVARARALAQARGWKKVAAVCPGGARRQDSVWAGLQYLAGCTWVAIHDGARPLLSAELIRRGLEAARTIGAAIAATPVKDTIKVAGPGDLVESTPERGRLWAIQTPQVFRYDLLCEAYRQARGEVTDDAALVEQLGHPVKLFMGSYQNIKITTPEDIAIAEAFLRRGPG